MDGIEVAKLSKSMGMRGLVLKSHWEIHRHASLPGT
jgi:hypothetical protein